MSEFTVTLNNRLFCWVRSGGLGKGMYRGFPYLFLIETFHNRNFFQCEVIELLHHLVNLEFISFHIGLFAAVGEVLFVFSDGGYSSAGT